MPKPIEIENIEEMRLREGIVDVELRDQIRGLQIGDLVKVTLLAMAKSGGGETVMVQITSIRGSGFRGKLTRRPVSVGLSKLPAGLPIAFTKAHIHSIPKEQLTMNPDSFILNRRNIHSTDSNSLLRLYDLANRIARQSLVQLEREMADKAIGRITEELQKRNVPL
jgi:hypothetical protein